MLFTTPNPVVVPLLLAPHEYPLGVEFFTFSALAPYPYLPEILDLLPLLKEFSLDLTFFLIFLSSKDNNSICFLNASSLS
jgi:hypothetical protein